MSNHAWKTTPLRSVGQKAAQSLALLHRRRTSGSAATRASVCAGPNLPMSGRRDLAMDRVPGVSNRMEIRVLVVMLVCGGVLLIDVLVEGQSTRALVWSALLLALGWCLSRARREQTRNN